MPAESVRGASRAARSRLAHGRSFEALPIDELNVDHSYQRDLDQTLAQKIARDYDIVAVDPIIVSMRPDGSLWIINGQHRAAAAKIAGETHTLAYVHQGLTPKQEADLRLKGNTRRTDKSQERFKAQLAAGYEESLAIKAICDNFGTRMNRWPDPDDGINAIATVEALYRHDDGVLLTRTFELIRDAWGDVGGENTAVSPLKAIGFFLTKHGSEFRRPHLVERLQKEGVDALSRRARGFKAMMGGALWANFYNAMIESYNKGLPEKSRLEPARGGTSRFATVASVAAQQEKNQTVFGGSHGYAGGGGEG